VASGAKTTKTETDGQIVKYRFRCPIDIWDKFKQKTPKSMTMNDALLDLVYKDLVIENPEKRIDNLNPKKKK